MKAEDLTIAEARAAFRSLSAEINPRADVFVSVNGGTTGSDLRATVYPEGMTRSASFPIFGDTWRELLDAARSEWAKRSATYNAATIRAMALKIIEVTADIGECTDRALRADFGLGDVERFAEAAAEQANALAAGGPFSVTITSGANARAV
jgi:hypothetical protein